MAMVVRERRHQQPLTLPLVPPPQSLPTLIPKQPFHFRLPSPRKAPLVDCLSDLEKLSILGHGSGGIVYKVLHRPTASILALKVLHPNHDHIYDNATGEADILRRVDSPYIVRCHAVLTNGSNLNFAMEYMPRGSLRDILYIHRTLPEHSIAAVARQVLEGLNYLHTIAIVHGDINPSNLLVGDEGEVKIADFGSSRIIGGRGGEGWGGTWAYMSPERFDSEGFGGREDGGGFAGDVWSLGVVILECYLGRFPLVGVGERFHWATVMCKVSFGGLLEVVPLKVSEEFRSFVGRCLEKDWRRRGSVRELLAHPFVSNSKDCAININLGLEDADKQGLTTCFK